MTNRRCPRCQSAYAAPARFCVKDGSPLVEVALPDAPPRSTPEPAPAPAAARGLFARETLTGQVFDERYAITRRLGEGGMSYVYLGNELATGREVAIKILTPRLSRDPAAVERLRREAAIAQRLDHPNVCAILRLGTVDGVFYLVMPYLPGEPLNEHETRRGRFPVEEGIPLLVQICHGLQHAHDLGIVHRDLKPENVMLMPDAERPGGSRAVVMDFGLAKERSAAAELAKLTQTGIVLGTPEFMSPEQIRGKPLDGRSDVYALGILAFEMFTGQLPFSGKTAQEMMLARLRAQPLALRAAREDLPGKLETVIAKALAVPVEERYSSMDEFGAALQAVIAPGVLGRLFGRHP